MRSKSLTAVERIPDALPTSKLAAPRAREKVDWTLGLASADRFARGFVTERLSSSLGVNHVLMANKGVLMIIIIVRLLL